MASMHTPDMAVDDLYSLSGMSDKNPDNLNSDLDDQEDNSEGNFFISHFDIDDFNDINSSANELAALESRIDDLLYLVADVTTASGMNKSFAMEAEKILPGFGNVPLGYYTETTTMTRYKVSLEEMSKGIWAMIAAAVAIIVGLIAKLFSRFSKKDINGTKAEAEAVVEEEIEELKTAEEVIQKTEKTVQKGDSLLNHLSIPMLDPDGNGFHCTSFQVAIDRLLNSNEKYGKAKVFLEFRDPIHYDIIKNGKYSKAIESVGGKIRAINDLLRTKIDIVVSVVKRNIHSSDVGDDMANAKKLNSVSASVELPIDGKTMKLEEIADYLTGIRHSLTDTSAKTDVNFDSLFMSLNRIYKTSKIVNILMDVKHSFETLEIMRKQMDSLDGILRNMATDGIPGAVNVEASKELRDIVTIIGRDIISFNKIYGELEYFSHTVQRMSKETVGFAQAVVGKITAEMRANEYRVPEGWQNIADELKEYKLIIKTVYLEMH